jgi:hypothetical protein
MPLGTLALPGPGVMPLAIGVLLGSASVGLLFATQKGSPEDLDMVRLGSRHILAAVLGLVWVSLFFEGLGFFLSLGVFLLILSKAFSRQGWIKPLAFAVLGVSAAYGFFAKLLGVSLPRGLF